MNYKPDEAALVAYLYGELEDEEQKKMEAYLLDNPSEKKRLEDWKETRSWMSKLEDKEVLAPPIIINDSHTRPLWRERYFRMTVGIAASFLLLLVAARLTGLSATYQQGELRIGFGGREKVQQPAPGLTAEKVGEMIYASLHDNNSLLQASLGQDRKSLEESIQKNLHANSNKIDRLMQSASATQERQVRQFVGQIQTDNLKLMKDYAQLSSAGQKEYIENLLVDFSKYLQEQRKQDLQIIQTRVSSMQENTDQFKKETEQIVSSLITNAGTSNQKSN